MKHVSKEEMAKILKNLTFTTALTEDDVQAITDVKDFSNRAGIIQDDVNINDFIDMRYLDALRKK